MCARDVPVTRVEIVAPGKIGLWALIAIDGVDRRQDRSNLGKDPPCYSKHHAIHCTSSNMVRILGSHGTAIGAQRPYCYQCVTCAVTGFDWDLSRWAANRFFVVILSVGSSSPVHITPRGTGRLVTRI